MLKIKDMNLNNVIRQGDTQPREYQLDTGNLNLNLANKQATIRLMTGDYKGIAYETTVTVSSENKISFSIDDVIPAREYRLEITVDDYVFPSRATDGRFDIDPSSHGQEVNVINVIGKEEIVRDVKARVENELEPFLGEIEQAELDRQAQEEARETAEGERDTAEVQRKADHANRSAEFDGKADKFVLKNLVENGDFSEGTEKWSVQGNVELDNSNYKTASQSIRIIADNSNSYALARVPVVNGHKIYINTNAYINSIYSSGIGMRLYDYSANTNMVDISLDYGKMKQWQSLSTIREVSNDGVNIYLGVNGTRIFDINYDSLLALDLTEAFGAGNEPDKAFMDELIDKIGYFNGTTLIPQSMTLALVSQKANKKQEDWITPTLLNGAVGTLKYRKNDFGRVEFRGDVKHADAGNAPFVILPNGYMTPSYGRLPVVSYDDILGSIATLEGRNRGALYLTSNLSDEVVSLNSITFEGD